MFLHVFLCHGEFAWEIPGETQGTSFEVGSPSSRLETCIEERMRALCSGGEAEGVTSRCDGFPNTWRGAGSGRFLLVVMHDGDVAPLNHSFRKDRTCPGGWLRVSHRQVCEPEVVLR